MNAGGEMESYYTRIQRAIKTITGGHKQVNLVKENFSQEKMKDFSCDLLKLKKSKQKYISKANPNRPQEQKRQNAKTISFEEFL